MPALASARSVPPVDSMGIFKRFSAWASSGNPVLSETESKASRTGMAGVPVSLLGSDVNTIRLCFELLRVRLAARREFEVQGRKPCSVVAAP